MYFKIIFLSLFVFSVLGFEQSLHRRQHSYRRGKPLKFSELVKREISENSEENPTEATEVPKDLSTEGTVDPTNALTKDEASSETPLEVSPIEEPKKDDLNVKVEGNEKIEREDESDVRPVTPEQPKEVEPMTPSSATPLPPESSSAPTLPPRPSVPSVTLPSVPANGPVYPVQPEYPSAGFPNYWQNPNWGNWGRFVPTNTNNWPQQWPTFNSWPSRPSVPSVPSVAAVPQIPSYSPSNYSPDFSQFRPYSPFATIPSSGVPTFSFIVPQNPYGGGGGRGFQYPGAQPSVPTYPGFQPSYQPSYQPRFIPSGGPTQGLIPGMGGRTPGYYPGGSGERPTFYPGVQPQSPRFYPEAGQTPAARPGSDPKRPMGPLGPEFMDDSDVAMIDPSLTGSRGGIRIFPGSFRRNFGSI